MGYCGRRNWGPLFWEPRADKFYPFKAWSRSEYSHACSIHCREFHPCLHFYLLGPFTFIFCSVITILLKITPVHHSRHWFSSSLQSVRKLHCKPYGQLDIKQDPRWQMVAAVSSYLLCGSCLSLTPNDQPAVTTGCSHAVDGQFRTSEPVHSIQSERVLQWNRFERAQSWPEKYEKCYLSLPSLSVSVTRAIHLTAVSSCGLDVC